jgi:hypothetical protein
LVVGTSACDVKPPKKYRSCQSRFSLRLVTRTLLRRAQIRKQSRFSLRFQLRTAQDNGAMYFEGRYHCYQCERTLVQHQTRNATNELPLPRRKGLWELLSWTPLCSVTVSTFCSTPHGFCNY